MKRAFTLIELLVVVAIIGILASMAMFALSGTREKGRDATRKSDLALIKSSLEVYYSDQKPNKYNVPATNPANMDTEEKARTATGMTTDYIKTIPVDPTADTTTPYVYLASADGQDYAVFAQLENSSDSQIKTKDPTAGARPSSYTNCFWVEND
jgi:prepilin-type N-terminal cleavage/methylation domain-containing protein